MSETTWFEAPGLLVPNTSLTFDKARAFEKHLEAGADHYSRIVECRAGTGTELVVFETEVSVPQGGSKYNIEKLERLAVVFYEADDRLPEVLALRTTFPRLSHQNLRDEEFPRSLCITDLNYDELRRRWTPRLLLQLIRTWLDRAALGYLHQEDQPLEPFFQRFRAPFIVPRDAFSRDSVAPLHVESVSGTVGSTVGAFVATSAGIIEDLRGEVEKARTIALAIRTHPTEHGVIRKQPETLEDIVSALEEIDFDLLLELRRRLREWRRGSDRAESLLSKFALILWIPKKRRADSSAPEAMDTFAALVVGKTVAEVGEDVGAWEIQVVDGLRQPIDIVGIGDDPTNMNRGKSSPVGIFPASFHFDRIMAAAMSGCEVNEARVLVVGAGALGSQVGNNLARSGFGRLTLVDDDWLFPHNLSRHVLGGSSIGQRKAEALAAEVNGLFIEDAAPQALSLNVLSKKAGEREQIEEAIGSADLILDLSASVAVSRYLAHIESKARRVSAYMNPAGSDLVMLVEDVDRHVTLHDLELQFYRALVAEDALSGHYESTGNRLRYGQGCRDVSVVLPNDRVALHGAIASSAIRNLGSEAAIVIWRADADGSVDRVDVAPSIVHRLTLGDWTVALDEYLVEILYRARSEKLPNETGGVLLGAHDLEHLTVHLTVGLPSPADSTEWPNLYIRGARDLSRIVANHERRTDGMLGYVGEWHSHPSGCSSSPSTLDRQAVANVAAEMSADGLPALTLIVGENDLTVLLQSGPKSSEARLGVPSGGYRFSPLE